MVRSRRGRSVIYNVDTDVFHVVLARVLEKQGLTLARVGRSIFIGSREDSPRISTGTAACPADGFASEKDAASLHLASSQRGDGMLGQIDIAPFPAMRHVTLHWRHVPVPLHEEIEDELRRNLDECRCLENPAAGWFLGISTLLFFSVFAVTVLLVLWTVAPRR